MEKLQKKKWLFLVAAGVLLVVWVVLGITSRNSKPEAIANKFFKAYEKQDVDKMVKCYAPELQKEIREELTEDNLSEWKEAVSEAVNYKIVVGDVTYGKGDDANTAEVQCAIIAKGGYDVIAGVEFETLNLVKVGKKWYIGE